MNDGDLESRVFKTMEGECITSLISGNDTQCFSTQQYVEARDKWIAKFTGTTRAQLGLEPAPIEFARKQLIASTIVIEVQPDVWKLREEE